MEKKALIIAGGSAISALYSRGIKPHLAIALDPTETEYKHLEKEAPYPFPLLYSSRLQKKVFSLFHGSLGFIYSDTLWEKEVLMQIRDLSVTYETRLGPVSAVDRVSFDIYKGEILGLVGESGCGKSTMGKALMRMIQPPGHISNGQLIFEGEDIMTYDDKKMRDFRGRKVSMIFQDPMTSLNPVQRVDEHITEAIQIHEHHLERTY